MTTIDEARDAGDPAFAAAARRETFVAATRRALGTGDDSPASLLDRAIATADFIAALTTPAAIASPRGWEAFDAVNDFLRSRLAEFTRPDLAEPWPVSAGLPPGGDGRPYGVRPWLHRMCETHRVWMVKERQEAIIVWKWTPHSFPMGRIAIQPLVDNVVQPVQLWHVDVWGRGFDHSQILDPYSLYSPGGIAPLLGDPRIDLGRGVLVEWDADRRDWAWSTVSHQVATLQEILPRLREEREITFNDAAAT